MKKKIFTILLVTCLTLLYAMPVGAQSLTSDGDITAQVDATSASTWEITIPNFTINTATRAGTGTVSVVANLGSDSTLTATPASTVTLTQSGKPDVIVDVTQTKTTWTAGEVSATPTTATVNLLARTAFEAGTYNGGLVFQVRCNDTSALNAAKTAVIENLELFGAGDSVMEGFANGYKGVLDTMAVSYRAPIGRDDSSSGAFITKEGTEEVTDIQAQTGMILGRIGTYTEDTVFIFDGGGNDLMEYQTKTEASQPTNITLNNWGHPDTDIGSAYISVVSAVDALQDAAGVEAPIIFIQHDLSRQVGSSYNDAWKFTFDSAKASMALPNVIHIDVNTICSNEDYQADNIHLKQSGYDKIATAISDALYDYYTP